MPWPSRVWGCCEGSMFRLVWGVPEGIPWHSMRDGAEELNQAWDELQSTAGARHCLPQRKEVQYRSSRLLQLLFLGVWMKMLLVV